MHCCCNSLDLTLAKTDMVAKTNEPTNSSPDTITKDKDNTRLSEQSGSNTLTLSSSAANDLPLIWKSLENQGLSTLSPNLRDKVMSKNIDLISKNGNFTVMRGKLIQLTPLYPMELTFCHPCMNLM